MPIFLCIRHKSFDIVPPMKMPRLAGQYLMGIGSYCGQCSFVPFWGAADMSVSFGLIITNHYLFERLLQEAT